MGLTYLGGKSWEEVTREERFYCARLFALIQRYGVGSFVALLNQGLGENALDVAANWEVAYEACLYRDLWQLRGRSGELYSPKRTFDLCLFSDNAIVVIEAKAQQGFDNAQLQDFIRDKQQIKKETGVSTVLLVGIGSNKYALPQDMRIHFECYITWKALSAFFAGDSVLQRADDIYESGAWDTFGKNNSDGYMTGAALLEAHSRGENFLVGRQYGLDGATFTNDIASGNWKNQLYETNRSAEDIPNRNWFGLSDFAEKVRSSQLPARTIEKEKERIP